MTDAPEAMWRELIAPCKMYPNGGSFYYEKHKPVTVNVTEYRRGDLPPTPEQIMADPRVQALVRAVHRMKLEYRPLSGREIDAERDVDAALAALEKP